MKNIGMVVAVEIQAILNKYGSQLEELSFPGYRVKKYQTEKYTLLVLDCGAGAVSYTHLEVYKRQATKVASRFSDIPRKNERQVCGSSCVRYVQ